MSQSSFSKRTSLWHALSCLYSGTDTSNSPADLDRAAMSLFIAAMLFCCWPERKKRTQPGNVCQGPSPTPAMAPSPLQCNGDRRVAAAGPDPPHQAGSQFWSQSRSQSRSQSSCPSPAPLCSSILCTGPGEASQGQRGQWWPWHPPLPYLVQRLVGISVSV